jgi:hypothetical protein
MASSRTSDGRGGHWVDGLCLATCAATRAVMCTVMCAVMCAVACAVIGAGTFITAAAAQAPRPRVALEVRPHPGDTLHITLEHAYTITGGPRGFPDSTTTLNWMVRVMTRDVVERSDTKGTYVQAVVDSVRMNTTGSLGSSPFPGVDRSVEGLRVRLQVMPDGSSNVIEGLAQVDPELRDILGAMPAVLPGSPVAVGESWTRDLPLPEDGAHGAATPAGTLRAVFRLDSLTSNGDLAWISLQGRVEFAPKPRKGESAGVVQMSGTLTGLLLLDRSRGWLSESRATMTVESVVTTPGTATPLLVKVRVNQMMRTSPARR